MGDILTHEQAQAVTNLTDRMLTKAVRLGKIPCAQLGEIRLYPKRLLIEAVESIAIQQQQERAKLAEGNCADIQEEIQTEKPAKRARNRKPLIT